jgi:hypothetical protein
VLFLLFFGVSLMARGVWWPFLWPAVVMAAPYWGYAPHMVVPAHDPYFWAAVVVSIIWMILGAWTDWCLKMREDLKNQRWSGLGECEPVGVRTRP